MTQAAARAGQRFPASLRLRRRGDFLRIQRHGVKVAADPLLGLALRNAQGVTRLGITISKKVGNAVVRNRIRRALREVFRRQRDTFPEGIDLVLIATSRASRAKFFTLCGACTALADDLRRRFP
jgi:ribonuclease P protein component